MKTKQQYAIFDDKDNNISYWCDTPKEAINALRDTAHSTDIHVRFYLVARNVSDVITVDEPVREEPDLVVYVNNRVLEEN